MLLNILFFIVAPFIMMMFFAYCLTRHVSDLIIVFSFILALISALLLCCGVVIAPIGRYIDYPNKNQQYHAFVETLEKARERNPESIEHAAVLAEIATWNQQIKSAQYWQPRFPLFIPELVNEWKMID